jgi:pyridoxine kinase
MADVRTAKAPRADMTDTRPGKVPRTDFADGPPGRVLSIQSHVVHGCVGNRAASLALQLLGVETDILNTVQYSNHVGYGSFAGEKLNGEQVWTLLQGMHSNGLLSPARLLTGYMGSAEAVRAVVRALPLLREANSEFQYWCDPVLGDNGRLYVPPALVDVYREEVLPYAHALLPNQFEAEQLTGIEIRTVSDARRACAALHRTGVKLVMITSSQLMPEGSSTQFGDDRTTSGDPGPAPPLTVLLSRRAHGSVWRREYLVEVPQLPQHFAGTGDLLAALLVGWDLLPDTTTHAALRRALAGVRSVLQATVDASQPQAGRASGQNGSGGRPLGLRLLPAIDLIRAPDESIIGPTMRLDSPLRGVLLIMGPDDRDASDAMRRWPGLVPMLKELHGHGLRVAIATQMGPGARSLLLEEAGLPANTFDPVLTNPPSQSDAPERSIPMAACQAWDLPPAACLVVSESLADLRCGQLSGMSACLVSHGQEEDGQLASPTSTEVDLAVKELSELAPMIRDAVLEE